MSGRQRKYAYTQRHQEIEEQVLDCMDEISDAMNEYHLAVRYTALRRLQLDEENILKSWYKFKDMSAIRQPKGKKPDDKMII